jgi:5-hydroxyisourate hydrolase-like protein (transthyretin family)
VKVSVYDISGREVAVLVNEELKVGVYEVRFDAGDLPNGVYFYRMEADKFTETKKLILLK